MTRKAHFAGHFYEKDFGRLNRQIEECFYSKFGPGELPLRRGDKKIKAVIVPHAGYMFSGPCAAWAYKEIAESKMPSAFLILGLNHSGNDSALSVEDWETPLGVVKTGRNLVKEIKDATGIQIDEGIHKTEHSIEVQLPLLQFACRDSLEELRIVSLIIGRDIDLKDITNRMYALIKRKDIVIIVSSDFTHYGPSYGYIPFSSDIPRKIRELDRGVIERIMEIDSTGFMSYINKTGITVCGYLPLSVFLMIMENEKPTPQLLMHYLSGDIIGDYRNSVSYASILFK